ncbi:MAG: penicillin-binding protein 2 [Candidatus Staskawiczbacteria bacterium]|nr:penicillin-binding protein 2 [Candidatus Staskawiczbacteria bacterium]
MNFNNKYRIKNSSGNIETHEVFLDNLAKRKEEELGISEKKLEVPLKERVIFALFIIFLLLASIFFVKIFYLQVVSGKKLLISAQNNKGRISLIRPERGIIYDRNLNKLVSNSPVFDLVCDRRNFIFSSPETTKKIEDIAGIVGKDSEILKKEIINGTESIILIYDNIPYEKLLILETRINEFPECKIEKNTARNYVFGESFSHLLGYTSRINQSELDNSSNYAVNDYIGKQGIEKSYEEFLRGVTGKLEEEKNAVGVKFGEKVLSEPKSGKNIVLSIDLNLQNKIYEELKKGIEKIGVKKGSAIAMDPRTGQILALVSYPSYDNNIFSKSISQDEFDKIQNNPTNPLFNRAISAQYPIGSTIKPFIASGALQENLISPDKKILDNGSIEIRSKYDPSIVYRFSGVEAHGLVDMRKAIAVSSNIYFYTVGGGYGDQQGLGPTRIKKYLELFGLGEKTDIDIPGEFSGFIPSPEWKKQTKNESWWDGDTYNLSIGQSDLKVTPLQIAMAYCSIANGGILYKPQIVQKIIDTSEGASKTVQEFKPEIIRDNFIDTNNLQVVREGMRDGVLYGSSVFLNSLPVHIAAKTGTAETSRTGYYDAWVSTFAPYENPEIVLVTTIEDVQGLSSTTLSITKEILRWYFSKK